METIIPDTTQDTEATGTNDVNLKQGSVAPLSESAMLVSVTITGWLGRKKDMEVTREVAERHNANEDVGAYWKRLVDKAAVNAVRAAAQQARNVVYEFTFPWEQDGERILPSALFDSFQTKLAEAEERWIKERDNLLKTYPDLVAKAEEDMNGLFRRDDYPTVEQLSKKFSWKVLFKPVGTADNFLVNIADSERQRIQKKIRANEVAAMEGVQQDVCQRLHKVVSRFFEQMSDTQSKNKSYHEALIKNMSDCCAIMRAANLHGDPKIAALATEVEKTLCGEGIETYRGHEKAAVDARANISKASKVVLDKVEAFI